MAALMAAMAAMSRAVTTTVATALLLADPALKSLREKRARRLPTLFTQWAAPTQRRRKMLKHDMPKEYSRRWYEKRGQQFSKRKARRERRAARSAIRANAERYREDFMEARRGLYPVPVDVISTDGQADTLWLSPFTKVGEVRKLIADRLGFAVSPAALLAGSSVMMDADVLLMYDFDAIIAGNCCGVPGGVPPPKGELSVVVVHLGTVEPFVLVVAQKGNQAALRTAIGNALLLPSSPQDMRIDWRGASSDVSTARVFMTLRGGGGGDSTFCRPCGTNDNNECYNSEASDDGSDDGSDDDSDADFFERQRKHKRAATRNSERAPATKRARQVGSEGIPALVPVRNDDDSNDDSDDDSCGGKNATLSSATNRSAPALRRTSGTANTPSKPPRALKFCCRYNMMANVSVAADPQDSGVSHAYLCKCQRSDGTRNAKGCCFLCAVETIDKHGNVRLRCICSPCQYRYIDSTSTSADKARLLHYQRVRLTESEGFGRMTKTERMALAKAQIDAAVMKRKPLLGPNENQVMTCSHLFRLPHSFLTQLLPPAPTLPRARYNSTKTNGSTTGVSARTRTRAGVYQCVRAPSHVSIASRRQH